MKNITTLIISTLFITTIGFGQPCDIENLSQSLSETPFSTNGAVEMRGESVAAIDNNSILCGK